MRPLDDPWVWDGGWEELPTAPGPRPGPRFAHALAWDAGRGRLVLFGGAVPTSPGDDRRMLRDDLWGWERGAGRWTSVSQPRGGPPARAWHATAYDPVRRHVLVFGGKVARGQRLERTAELWSWDGERWALQAEDGPAPRSGAGLCWAGGDRVLLFGGSGEDGRLADTWAWDGAAWSAAAAGVAPSARSTPRTVWTGEGALLFGGRDARGDRDDTWLWRGGRWRELTPARPPPARSRHALVWDARREAAVLLGGVAGRSPEAGLRCLEGVWALVRPR